MIRLFISIALLLWAFLANGQETAIGQDIDLPVIETPYDQYVLYERNLDGQSLLQWLKRPEYHFINEYKACMQRLPDSFKVALFDYHGVEHIEHIKNHLGRILVYKDYLNDEEGTANHYFHGANNFHESSKRLLEEPNRFSMEIKVPLIQAVHCFSMYKSALMAFSHDDYYEGLAYSSPFYVYSVKNKRMELYHGSRADLRRDNIQSLTGAHDDTMAALDLVKSIRIKKKDGRHDRESMLLANPPYPNKYLNNTPLDNVMAAFECGDGYFKEKTPEIFERMVKIHRNQKNINGRNIRDSVKDFIYDFNKTLTFSSFENPPMFLCFVSEFYETPLI